MAVVHLSPELPRLTVRGHKREPSEPIDLLSASLGASPSLAADGDDSPGLLQRSYSGRPRSSSSSSSSGTSSQAVSNKQRKSLRLSRSRPVSWMNKTKQGGDGGTGHNRRGSASDADNATTQQIDSAFTKIKEQLAKLSEEDEVLKERVEKLNEEVNILNTSTAVRCLHTQRGAGQRAGVLSVPWKSASFSGPGGCHSRMPSSPATVPIVLVSSSSQDSLDRLEELETVQNNQNVFHCTGINGIADNPSEINIHSTIENVDSPTKSTFLHNLSPLSIS